MSGLFFRRPCGRFATLAAVLGVSCTLDIATPDYGSPGSWDPALNTHPDGSAFQELLDRHVHDGLPGAVLYLRTPAGIWNGAAGYARLEGADPMLPTHLHHAASVTKMYTATAVMLLTEDGLVDLDRTIMQYLPRWAYEGVPNATTATVRQVLGHTSGIPDFGDSFSYELDTLNDPFGDYSPKRLLQYVKEQEALFTPGGGYFYSNTDYVLLALLIEQVTGEGHAEVISQRIIQPLGLAETFYGIGPGSPTPVGLVNSYQDLLGDGRIANVSDLSAHAAETAFGQAGLIASASDFATFLEALLGASILGPGSLDEMQDHTRCDCYGLGLSFLDTAYGVGIGHDGGDVGTRTEVRYFPSSDATLVLLTNGGNGGVPDRQFDQLWSEVLTAALGS
jgi:D-alanyl-D-alanine carboxypeptidase